MFVLHRTRRSTRAHAGPIVPGGWEMPRGLDGRRRSPRRGVSGPRAHRDPGRSRDARGEPRIDGSGFLPFAHRRTRPRAEGGPASVRANPSPRRAKGHASATEAKRVAESRPKCRSRWRSKFFTASAQGRAARPTSRSWELLGRASHSRRLDRRDNCRDEKMDVDIKQSLLGAHPGSCRHSAVRSN